MTPTEHYIEGLTHLKPGDLGLLRTHAGAGLDESVSGFDLFTGLWWPLRHTSERVPRREVAWLIAKLYAFRPIEHSPGAMLASRVGLCCPSRKTAEEHFAQRFDRMLRSPLARIEPSLQWALDVIASANLALDWAALTDDLSIWERQTTRLRWAERYIVAAVSDRRPSIED